MRLYRRFATNPFAHTLRTLSAGGHSFQLHSLPALGDSRLSQLPYSIRVLLESAVRNCDNFSISPKDIESILNWAQTSQKDTEIPFKPARVLLQDLTGVPAVVDLATMRDAVQALGGRPEKINPQCPVDLVVDHSVQVDASRSGEALKLNEAKEFERNSERFRFLKWGQAAFDNLRIVPPGSGIVHQVNLEYLAKGVIRKGNLLYPDSVVGTDSHTTMINGIGVVGWGVGGIEAEAVMLGQSISMVLPQVVGFRLTGELATHVTATDLVLTITQMLRKRGVVGKFVEFFGPGCSSLSVPDRATIANMAPEYGATIGFFPFDSRTLDYMRQTGRPAEDLAYIEAFHREQGLYREGADPLYSGNVMDLDLSSVQPCVSGPKRPQDRVSLSDLKSEFLTGLTSPVSFKGYGLTAPTARSAFQYRGKDYQLHNGSVVIAAITSCTNTSNPDVLISAGLLARKAVEKGLAVAPYIKTSLSPGSKVVPKYLERAGLMAPLEALGFHIAGFGCMTCIGNSGELDPEVTAAIEADKNLIAGAVLSGNRNFEGRVHPLTRANYLASPPLVVAFALAGRLDIDFKTDPIGKGHNGKDVFLADIWPTRDEVAATVRHALLTSMFQQTYATVLQGSDNWQALQAPKATMYEWDPTSTYIHKPPFFEGLTPIPEPIRNIVNGKVLLNLGNSITTDHISPAGNIAKSSSAAVFLASKGVQPQDFNTYGSRRGNDEIMARGTFANIRLVNKMVKEAGPFTVYVPTSEKMRIFEAAQKYKEAGTDVIVMAGKEYGSGSSRDWAAKGPLLLGVRAVIAESYERIHRSNLVGMGILPLQFLEGQSADSLGLTGLEDYSIDLQMGRLKVGQTVQVRVSEGKTFQARARIDTDLELEYYRHGGILHYVVRQISAR